MESSMKKYAKLITENRTSPHFMYDGKKSGLIVDPSDGSVPVDIIGFGAYQLEDGPFEFESEKREMVFIPIDGEFRLTTGGKTFSGGRKGGQFDQLPRKSNISAVYVPPASSIRLEGEGEMVFFTAPATPGNPSVQVNAEDAKLIAAGAGFWRRDFLILVSPDRISKNLTAGETYSPAGHWSGTPLHVHDKHDPEHGQSDHEEVYYHRFRLKEGERFGAYGIQLLFDGKELDKSYIIHDRSVIAIPGGSHPVVSGPMSDHVYTYALAGREGAALLMLDIPEFKYLKAIGEVLKELEKERGQVKISRDRLKDMKALQGFTPFQWKMLENILAERGFTIL